MTPAVRAVPRQSGSPLLEVDDLRVDIVGRTSVLHAVRGVSFTLEPGRTLGIVGESGSGKSLTARAVMSLLPRPMVKLAGGDIRLNGRPITALSDKDLSRVRGREISMIFQDPLSSLNPVMRVGQQIAEVLQRHKKISHRNAIKHAIELMERVGIPAAAQRINSYPHQFSGGMRQRVMIAMAIAVNPAILVADEPTTALDVTVQSQILELLSDMQAQLGMALLLITHDLSVVARSADDVSVMYAGQFVETGRVNDVFLNPTHPYTQGLLASMPRLDRTMDELDPMPGRPPALGALPPGCPFHTRCPHVRDRCRDERPLLRPVDAAQSSCHFAEEIRRHRVAR